MTIDNTFAAYLKTRQTLFEERFNQAVDYLNSVYPGVCIVIYKSVSQMGNDEPIVDKSCVRIGVIEYSDISHKPYQTTKITTLSPTQNGKLTHSSSKQRLMMISAQRHSLEIDKHLITTLSFCSPNATV